MSSSFNSVAADIIRDSIKSAIFIDDNVWLPFEEKKPEKYINHSDLFYSFRKKGCTLAYYRYQEKKWEEKNTFLFENRDLLILDWELASGQGYQNKTLEILEKAIQTPSLHFCVIYTETEKENFKKEIILPSLSYFMFCSVMNKDELENLKNDFIEFCEVEIGIDYKKVLEEITPLIEEIVFYNEDEQKVNNAKKNVIKKLNNLFKKDFDQIRTFLTDRSDNLFNTLISILYSFEENETSQTEEKYDCRVSPKNGTWKLYINNTVIMIGNKNDIKEEGGLYEVFRQSLIQEHNIFLTLLGLEMRNLFRKSSGFIGKELDGIDETAFFYQHKNNEPKEAFYEFLKEVWVDQATSFLYENTPTLYEYIEEYKKQNKIGDKVEKFQESLSDSEEYQEYLCQLNNLYNQLKIKRKESDDIRFGDIFTFQKEGEKKYLLCITPHCDCVRPSKINNQFFFVQNKSIIDSTYKALDNAETNFISFIKDNTDNLVCIDWGLCKPFTLHVPENNINTLNSIGYQDQEADLEYIATLKENYAQRIANNAFGYPLRVGIIMANT